ncbi:hypothetical protein CAPTEDRAFT_222790 [Capitella teleta]|uniref:Transmembrane protein 272-like n=1 Tax=Capitella teleta TaxID=283909 RepID=R7VHE8_CAPTE|nr:hypothetical protein CAPTEDRAFT_222790 [Capitella teleta]|eukprot:ELU18049.1 hypothetical protein CAPTEDRAFT_222790 [Capitella teleta]
MADVEKQEDAPPAYGSTEMQGTGPPAAGYNEPPPSYDSVVGRVRGIRENSATNVDFTKNLCTFLLCGTVGLACTIVFSIGLPIAHIVIGAVYLDDCPVERFIPIYLVVAGCFLLVKGIMSIVEAYHKKDLDKDEEYQRPRVFSCGDGPIGCFMFCWFIAGNVWIFSNVNKYQSEDPALSNFCNATLYLYAYWVTIATYILMAVVLFLMCCAGCVACCCGSGNQGARN